MKIEELPKMMDWLNKEFGNLPFDDQIKIINASAEFVKALEPIYMKNTFRDGKATFLFRL